MGKKKNIKTIRSKIVQMNRDLYKYTHTCTDRKHMPYTFSFLGQRILDSYDQ